MQKYLIMPERCSWYAVEATSAEMAYRGICSLYEPRKRIAVIDMGTREAVIFTRKLDRSGNLDELEVIA